MHISNLQTAKNNLYSNTVSDLPKVAVTELFPVLWYK